MQAFAERGQPDVTGIARTGRRRSARSCFLIAWLTRAAEHVQALGGTAEVQLFGQDQEDLDVPKLHNPTFDL